MYHQILHFKISVCQTNPTYTEMRTQYIHNRLHVSAPTECHQQGVMFQNFYVLPVIVYLCFVYDIGTTVMISLRGVSV